MLILSVLGDDVMDAQFVFFSVSICNPVSISIYPAYISIFYSDSKELVLFANQKSLHNWVALPNYECLLVVGMFLQFQKMSLYDYNNLDYGFKVMFIGKKLFILRVRAKVKFCCSELKGPAVSFCPLFRKFL